MSPWLDAFLDSVGVVRAEALLTGDDPNEIEAYFDAWLMASAQRFPAIHPEYLGFARHLGRHFPSAASMADGLAAVHGADLFLAYHVLIQSSEALALFEVHAMKDLASAVRTMGDARFADEVRQATRIRLLVADERPESRLADYTGQGPLAGWVRVTAARIGLQMTSQKRDTRTDRELDALTSAASDPELEFLRARYAAALRAALKSALTQLGQEERAVLKMHHADGLTVAEIGQILGVHKATAARWIVDAREKATKILRQIIETELGVRRSEAESLMGLVDSRFDASIASALAS